MAIPPEARDEVELLHLDLTLGDLNDGDDNGNMTDQLLFKVAEPEPELEQDEEYKKDVIKSALRSLTNREREAICRLFGIDQKAQSVSATASAMAVSPARICILKQKALRKLKESLPRD